MASLGDELRALDARRRELAGATVAVRRAMKQVRNVASNAKRAQRNARHRDAVRTLCGSIPCEERAASVVELTQQLSRGGSSSHGESPAPPAAAPAPQSHGESPAPPAAAPLVPGRWAVERACQFRREWRLHAWIREQNERSGQAPCGPHIWAAWRALTAGAPNVSEGLRGAPLGLDRRGKQWVRRLARRWRLLRVRPRPGAGLSLDALRAKDRRRPRAVAECRKIAPRVRLPGPKKGPENGPTF